MPILSLLEEGNVKFGDFFPESVDFSKAQILR